MTQGKIWIFKLNVWLISPLKGQELPETGKIFLPILSQNCWLKFINI
jgi:hypothetical protein